MMQEKEDKLNKKEKDLEDRRRQLEELEKQLTDLQMVKLFNQECGNSGQST